MKISMIGCGWLGLPLAVKLIEEGHAVKGSVTAEEKRAVLTRSGVEAVRLKLTPEPEGDLDALLEADAIVISIPPRAGAYGDAFHPEQIRVLTEAIRQKARPPYVIYVSSTSVYPENNRTCVEADVTRPEESAAPALVESERHVLGLGNATVVRCGGLMGYDRIPGKYVAGKENMTTGAIPVNYIHRDDAVGVLTTLLATPQPGQTLNAVAPEHPTREAVYRKSCADFGYAPPTFAEPAVPPAFKLISSARLEALPYAFRYPDPLGFYYVRP